MVDEESPRTKPWFEKFPRLVWVLVIIAVVSAFTFSSYFNAPKHFADTPILAFGDPDLPQQPDVGASSASRDALRNARISGQNLQDKIQKIFDGTNLIDEDLRLKFDECDQSDRFTGINLPLRDVTGRTILFGCRTDPNRLRRLQRWPNGVVIFDSRLAVSASGTLIACSDPRSPLRCNTALSVIDRNTRNLLPIDGDKIPFISLPVSSAGTRSSNIGFHFPDDFQQKTGIRVGDLGLILYRGRMVPIVVADGSHPNKIGEGSLALHRLLGRELCLERNNNNQCIRMVRSITGIASNVITIVFPGSALNDLKADDVADRIVHETWRLWEAHKKMYSIQ